MPETSEKPKRRSARPPETGWELGAGGLGKVAWSVLAVLLGGAGDPAARERIHRVRGDHPDPGRGRGGQPALTGSPEAEALAQALRAALPETDPFDVNGDELARAVAAAGADPGDDALVSAALVAWESLLP